MEGLAARVSATEQAINKMTTVLESLSNKLGVVSQERPVPDVAPAEGAAAARPEPTGPPTVGPPPGFNEGDEGVEAVGSGMGVDTKILGKPPEFMGEDRKWAEWKRIFLVYAGCVHQYIQPLFDKIDSGIGSVMNRDLGPKLRAASLQLSFILVMLTRGEAGVLVENAGRSEGAMAWLNLLKRYEP